MDRSVRSDFKYSSAFVYPFAPHLTQDEDTEKWSVTFEKGFLIDRSVKETLTEGETIAQAYRVITPSNQTDPFELDSNEGGDTFYLAGTLLDLSTDAPDIEIKQNDDAEDDEFVLAICVIKQDEGTPYVDAQYITSAPIVRSVAAETFKIFKVGSTYKMSEGLLACVGSGPNDSTVEIVEQNVLDISEGSDQEVAFILVVDGDEWSYTVEVFDRGSIPVDSLDNATFHIPVGRVKANGTIIQYLFGPLSFEINEDGWPYMVAVGAILENV